MSSIISKTLSGIAGGRICLGEANVDFCAEVKRMCPVLLFHSTVLKSCPSAQHSCLRSLSVSVHTGNYVFIVGFDFFFFWRKQQTLIVPDTSAMFLSSAQLSGSSFLCGVWLLCRGGVCISEHANLYFISKQVCKSFC